MADERGGPEGPEIEFIGGREFQELMTKLADGAEGDGATLSRKETGFVMRAVAMMLEAAPKVRLGEPPAGDLH